MKEPTRINIRLTKEQKEQIEQNAYRAGLTVSAYVRSLALKGA